MCIIMLFCSCVPCVPDLFYLLLCYMAATLVARCFTDLLHITWITVAVAERLRAEHGVSCMLDYNHNHAQTPSDRHVVRLRSSHVFPLPTWPPVFSRLSLASCSLPCFTHNWFDLFCVRWLALMRSNVVYGISISTLLLCFQFLVRHWYYPRLALLSTGILS